MIILLSGLFIAGVALAVYAFVPFQWGGKKPQESPPTPILPEPLEQLNVERQNLQSELELANNVARQLQEELAKFKENAGIQQLQQLKENKEKLELAQKDNQELTQKIKTLEEQIEKQKAIIQQPAPAAKEQVSKPVPEEEQVSKKEYDELKKKLEEAEQILRIIHGAGNKEEAK